MYNNYEYTIRRKIESITIIIVDLNNNCIKQIDDNFEKTAIKKKKMFSQFIICLVIKLDFKEL